jgi:transposase-like protein
MMQARVKGLVRQVFRAPSHSVALKHRRDLIDPFRARYSAAIECLERDLDECVTHLRFPEPHSHRIRTTNRLERPNGEGRRRTKIITRSPTVRSCLTLLRPCSPRQSTGAAFR